MLDFIATPSDISICTIKRAMTPVLPDAIRLPTPLKGQPFEQGNQLGALRLLILDLVRSSGQTVSCREARDFQHIFSSTDESQNQYLGRLDYDLVRLRDSINMMQEMVVQNNATCKFSFNEVYQLS